MNMEKENYLLKFEEKLKKGIKDNEKRNFKMPLLDNNGEISYMGKRYKNKEVKIECQ